MTKTSTSAVIGAVASCVLLMTPSGDGWFGPGLPGLAAAVAFWKILGYESAWGVAVAWTANAIVYGAGAYWLLNAMKPSAAPRPSE